MTRILKCILSASLLLVMPAAEIANAQTRSPEAASRTHAQNYKDMVLATCVATAYKNDRAAAVDGGSSVSALREWTLYDLEKAPDAIRSLVDSYLARDYHNPLAEAEVKGVRFDLLKCLDLYHSKELEAQVRRLVIDPKRSDRKR